MNNILSGIHSKYAWSIVFLTLGLLLTPDSKAAKFNDQSDSSSQTKIIAAPGLINPHAQGVTLLQDYGSFALYRVDNSKYSLFSLRNKVQDAELMDTIQFTNHPVNTKTFNPDTFSSPLRANAGHGAGLHLIQFIGPIKNEWLQTLKSQDVKLVHYIANNAYLVWVNEKTRLKLDNWAKTPESSPFIQFSMPHQPYLKLEETLERKLEKQLANPEKDNKNVSVIIQLYQNSDLAVTEAFIKAKTIKKLASEQKILSYKNLQVKIAVDDIAAIAELPDVVFIQEIQDRKLLDEVQGQILAGNFNVSQSGPSGPGYLSWLTGLGFSTNSADYPIVDIVDDGIGNGLINSGDPTLNDGSATTRLSFVDNCSSATDASSVNGHGHLAVSVAGGLDTRLGSPFQDILGFQRGLGINPFGRFAGTRVFSPGFNISAACGGTDAGLIQHIWQQGARITSNSWGFSSSTYNTISQAYDAGVRDADASALGNQELTMVFAAGNSGSIANAIKSPGNAKNVITVGASENQRPLKDDGTNWTDGCGYGPTTADNAMDVFNFSSRGPAPGGRTKPELVAPGTHVQGTASTSVSYTGSSLCNKFWPLNQTAFAAHSGTSISTPAVAGIASLTYRWLNVNHGIPSPSPALIKAFMMAHTTYLTGVGANDTLPSNAQGYGMPNMSDAFDITTEHVLLDQTQVLTATGQTATQTVQISDPSKPVRITLAYTDAVGTVGTSPQVNNLDLSVTVGANTYKGNVFSGSLSATGGIADNKNNYEAVFLPPGNTGSLDITVTATNIVGDGITNSPIPPGAPQQDFALVCSNCTQTPSFTLDVTPATLDYCGGGAAQTLATVNIGQIFGFSNSVALTASGDPAIAPHVSFLSSPVTPPGTSSLIISGSIPTGSYSFNVVGTSNPIVKQKTINLNVSAALATAPNLTLPANGAIDQTLNPTFTWDAIPDVLNYTFELANDIDFTSIIDSKTLNGTSYTPAITLLNNHRYFWRVRSNNSCGSSNFSVFNFGTAFVPVAPICSNPNVVIPDFPNPGITDSIVFANTRAIADLKFSTNTNHSYTGDLVFTLTHVDTGSSVKVIDRIPGLYPGPPPFFRPGGCPAISINATLDDAATSSLNTFCKAPVYDPLDPNLVISPGTPNITGSLTPSHSLSVFNEQSLSGNWRLDVTDLSLNDTGTLKQWCLIPTVHSDRADLAITKTASVSAIIAGDPLSYTITVNNNGPDTANNVTIQDTLPGCVTISSVTGCANNPAGTANCLLPSIPATGSTSYTVNVDTTGCPIGTITNNALAVSDTPDPVAGNDTSSVSTSVVSTKADLGISLAGSAPSIFAGDTLIYTATVTNTGPSPATKVVVTNTLPACVTALSTSAPADCTINPDHTVTCLVPGVLAVSGTVSYAIDVNTSNCPAGTITDTATVSSDTADTNATNNTATVDTNVSPSADLSITKIASANPVVAGSSLTYTITVTNQGPNTASSVDVTDTLPTCLSISSVANCPNNPAGTANCTLGDIAASASSSYTVTADTSNCLAGTIANTAVVSSVTHDPVSGNNSATASTNVVHNADLSITKTASANPVTAGNSLSYTLTVNNAGPSVANNVSVTDTLPACVTLTSVTNCPSNPSGTPNCNFGNIAASASGSYTVTVDTSNCPVGTITNQASVSSDATDSVPGNNTVSLNTDVQHASDLSITKTASPDPVTVGNTLTYTITVNNAGPSLASSVSVTDTLPSCVSLISTTGCTNDPNGAPNCTLGNIASTASKSYTIAVNTSNCAPGSITNTASVSSSSTDPNPANNTTSLNTNVVGLADLSVTKTASINPVPIGSTLTYTVTVNNAGPSIADNVLVNDNTGSSCLTGIIVSGCTNDPNGLPNCNLGSINSGGFKSYTITGNTTNCPVGSFSTQSTVSSSATDPAAGNNSFSLQTNVVNTSADLSISKTASANPVVSGSTLTYTVSVSNAGPDIASHVVVTDNLPGCVSTPVTTGCAEDSTGAPTCTLGDIAANASKSYTIAVNTSSCPAGLITNNASVASNTGDPVPGNNSVSLDTSVIHNADLSITKTASSNTVTAGDKLTYTVTINNAGPNTANNVIATDNLPQCVTVTSTTGCAQDPNGAPNCSLGDINAFASKFYSIVVDTSNCPAGVITNNASVNSDTPDPASGNNSTSLDTTVLKCQARTNYEAGNCSGFFKAASLTDLENYVNSNFGKDGGRNYKNLRISADLLKNKSTEQLNIASPCHIVVDSGIKLSGLTVNLDGLKGVEIKNSSSIDSNSSCLLSGQSKISLGASSKINTTNLIATASGSDGFGFLVSSTSLTLGKSSEITATNFTASGVGGVTLNAGAKLNISNDLSITSSSTAKNRKGISVNDNVLTQVGGNMTMSTDRTALIKRTAAIAVGKNLQIDATKCNIRSKSITYTTKSGSCSSKLP